MGKWRELAEQLEGHDNSDDSANWSVHAPNVTNVTNVNDLSPAIVTGLKRLGAMQAPRVRNTQAWRQAVSDALRLANEGWASRALALGWSALDLFGAVSDPKGCPHDDGLAAWLDGRKLSMLSATFALVEANGCKSYFSRHDRGGARLLWEFGN